MGTNHSTLCDGALLGSFLRHRDDSAFRTLVDRHLSMVLGTALRILSNRPLAEEAAQNVFLALARKAAWFSQDADVTGWLYRSAVLESKSVLRSEVRRLERETKAAQLSDLMKPTEANLLREHLDDAMIELSEDERQAILLRFFEGRALREVGITLGVSEDGAQRRVSAALEKLRRILGKRNVTLAGTGALATELGAESVTLPSGLVTSIVQRAVTDCPTGILPSLVRHLCQWTRPQLAWLGSFAILLPIAGFTLSSIQISAEQKTLSTKLKEARTELHDQESERLRLVRSLEVIRRSSQQLEANNARRNELARLSPPDASPRWLENFPYVRLPKDGIQGLSVFDPGMAGESDEVHEGMYTPMITRDGKVSRSMLKVMGFDDAEVATFQKEVKEIVDAYRALEMKNSRFVPDYHDNAERKSFPAVIIQPAGEEGKRLEQSLRDLIFRDVDKVRAELLWKMISNPLKFRYWYFPTREEIRTIKFFPKENRFGVTEINHGHFTQLYRDEDLPLLLQAYAREWRGTNQPKTP